MKTVKLVYIYEILVNNIKLIVGLPRLKMIVQR
jgi:hypothetical protein